MRRPGFCAAELLQIVGSPWPFYFISRKIFIIPAGSGTMGDLPSFALIPSGERAELFQSERWRRRAENRTFVFAYNQQHVFSRLSHGLPQSPRERLASVTTWEVWRVRMIQLLSLRPLSAAFLHVTALNKDVRGGFVCLEDTLEEGGSGTSRAICLYNWSFAFRTFFAKIDNEPFLCSGVFLLRRYRFSKATELQSQQFYWDWGLSKIWKHRSDN